MRADVATVLLAGSVLLAEPALADDDIRLWTSVFAGRSSLAGNTAQGTQAVKASIISNLIGGDTQLDDYNLVGASLGVSHQTFSSTGGNGGSDDVSLSFYARHYLWNGAYVAESLGYGWHDVSTRRVLKLLQTDTLEASFQAHDLGGRIEGGYTFRLDDRNMLAPFAAFVGDAYAEPAYGETATSGSPLFAVSYAATTIGVTHAELGSRYNFGQVIDNFALSLDGLVAWEHELDSNPLVLAHFQTFPGTNFVLRGTSPDGDTALVGLGARYQDRSGFGAGLRGDARLGPGTTILSGSFDFSYRW